MNSLSDKQFTPGTSKKQLKAQTDLHLLVMQPLPQELIEEDEKHNNFKLPRIANLKLQANQTAKEIEKQSSVRKVRIRKSSH